MTAELTYLMLTTLLTGVLWIPVVIGMVTTRGMLTPADYKVTPTEPPLPDWANRANRAHINAVENFAPFAAVVLVAHMLQVSTGVTAACAAIFFYARLAHAIVHIMGIYLIRTLLFVVGWVAFLVFLFETWRMAG